MSLPQIYLSAEIQIPHSLWKCGVKQTWGTSHGVRNARKTRDVWFLHQVGEVGGGPAECLFLLNFEEQNLSFPWLVRAFLPPSRPRQTKQNNPVKQQESHHAACGKPMPNDSLKNQKGSFWRPRVNPSWLRRLLQEHGAWWGLLRPLFSPFQLLPFTKTVFFLHKELSSLNVFVVVTASF